MLLTQNSKMRKTGNAKVRVFNWTIRAGVSCPYAGACNKVGTCYAQSGAYQFGNVRRKHEANLEFTKSPFFVRSMTTEIGRISKRLAKQGITMVVRIHDAGDFYSMDYLLNWIEIIRAFPNVTFYCYTKSVPLFKRLPGKLPWNFVVNYSMGGIADRWVDETSDRHVHIFESEEQLVAAGYTRNDEDDHLAFEPGIVRIGLVARWKMVPTWKGVEELVAV